MADEEAEKDRGPENDVNAVISKLKQRLEQLHQVTVTESQEAPLQASSNYCQDFCRTLLEYAGRWRVDEEPLPLVRVYVAALSNYADTSPYLSLECDNVTLVVERLSQSFAELLLSLKELPDDLWKEFKSCIQFSHGKLQENGIGQLSMLWTLGQQEGVWANPVLQSLLSGEHLQTEQIEGLLVQEGQTLLDMRVKQLMKEGQLEKAVLLAKTCSEATLLDGKGNFRQMYLVCLCATSERDPLMEELSKVDCHDALEMICNLESDGDEKAAFTLCSAFLTRQLLQADTYCAWELTLFWSKLLKRLEPSEKAFLDKCSQMSLLSKTVYHVLFLIKVIQSEIAEAGLPACIEMCIRALQMQSADGNTKATVCKTIACLLPNDLEVKRACQLTQFLLEPTVDSYYAVETLYNEPDQKVEEENMPVPNSLRCELLLVFKTQWPFDPEFWDWRTLKRHCLSLMGEEASIVSSIDLLNDTDEGEEDDLHFDDGFLESAERMVSGTYELTDSMDKKQKIREMKKLREKGFISARFRNWQVYMQYCVLCDKEFLGHRIIRHAQTHFSGGVYSCPICAQSFTSKETLTPHVTSHVKQSSKDRLTAMKTTKKLANPKTAAPVIAALIAKTENNVSENGNPLGSGTGSIQNVQAQLSVDHSEDNVCPVASCKKVFKFYRNLIAHVKAHGDNEEAKFYLEMRSKKVVCQYCRRHFVSVDHLNDHLQVHCGTKPYICIQLNCKASFLNNAELLVHRKTHTSFKARCMFPNCGKVFTEAFKLYEHEAQHYKTFTCRFTDCGKVFHTQEQLDLHIKSHAIKKEPEFPTATENASQNVQNNPSVTAQTISSPPQPKDPPPHKDETPPKDTNYALERCKAETVSVGKPETLENLLKVSQTPIQTVDRYEIKAEIKDEFSNNNPIENNSVIQSTNSAVLKVKHDGSYHALKTSNQNQQQQQFHVSPFEATINKMLREKTLLQSQLQMFSNNANTGLMNCSTAPVSLARPKTTTKPQTISLPAMLKAPPTAAGPSTETHAANPTEPESTTFLRERYHCAVETCPRNYSCYKSVAKHMKTTHPELYAERKITRSEIKVTYVPGSPIASKPAVVKPKETTQKEILPAPVRQNVIQSPPYTNMPTNYNIKPHLPSVVNQDASRFMENVLNPIVVAQLQSTVSQPGGLQTQHHPLWSPALQNEQSSKILIPRPTKCTTAPLAPKVPVCITDIKPNAISVDSTQVPTVLTNSIPIYRPVPTKIPLPPIRITPKEGQVVWSAPPQSLQRLNSPTPQMHPARPMESPSTSLPPTVQPCASMESDPNYITADSLTLTHITQSPSQLLYRLASNTAALPPTSQSKIQENTQWSSPPQMNNVPSCGPQQIHPNRPVLPTSTPLAPTRPPCIVPGTDPNQVAVNTVSSMHNSSQPPYNTVTTIAAHPPTRPQTQNAIEPCLPHPQTKHFAPAGPPQLLHRSPMESTNLPVPPKTPQCITVESNNIAAVAPASNIQRSTQPPLTGNIKTEELSQVISLTLNRDPKVSQNSSTMHNAGSSNQSTQPTQPTQPSQAQQEPASSDSNPQKRKRIRKSTKSRWPAIIKDGKFICSRCFREFKSSFSLGGHLSKRTSCVPLDEAEWNSDLPESFLDLLNSEQTANTPPPNPNPNPPYDPATPYYNKPHTSKTHSPLEQQNYTPQNYQENLAYMNGETSNDMLKQIMNASNMTDLFVQPNVPLFVRALHQSALSALEASKEQDQNKADEEEVEAKDVPPRKIEFRCQVKDCCQIFQQVSQIFHHYLRRHELSVDRVGDFLSGICLGRFTCGHLGCTESFTGTFWKFVAHVKEMHKDIKLSRPENMFKCEIDGCDRAYATKSNMQRHLMKKHNEYYRQKYQSGKSGNVPIPSSSVTPSVEGIRRDVCPINLPHVPQLKPPGTRCPAPLLSQVLKENLPNTTPVITPTVIPSESHPKMHHREGHIVDPSPVPPTVPPEIQPCPATNHTKPPERTITEQDIKKKLREQILAGDFQRRSNLSHLASTDTIESKSPMSCSSESSSKNEDNHMNSDSKGPLTDKETPTILPGTSAEIEELLKTQSFTCLRQRCSSLQDLQSPTGTGLTDDRDTEPQQLTPKQQLWFAQIQTAFEKLDLIREAPEPVSKPVKSNTSMDGSKISPKNVSDEPQTIAVPKLFICEAKGCTYNTISCESYWRHLYKVHNYTFDEVNMVKKRLGQYAPFQCQKCNKSFTRNPNLRTHYISAHKLPMEEIQELDMQRRQARAAMTRLMYSKPGAKQRSPASVNPPFMQNVNPMPANTVNNNFLSVIQALPTPNLHSQALKPSDQSKAGHSVPQRTVPQNEIHPQPHKAPVTPENQANSLTSPVKAEKKPKSSDAASQYKPYRCVHQGCEAAFAIQHNLILHYRAVHQSALSALEVNKEQDQNDADEAMEEEGEEEEQELEDLPLVSEFRCQVKDCSRVFQQVLHLMQHYLRLHEFGIDRVGDLMSGICLGRFTCCHQGCTVAFTAFWKYVAHIKEMHKDIKLSRPENIYKCEIDGCDRAYATKSNMQRHLMKKHNDFYQRKYLSKSEDGVKQNSKALPFQMNKTSDGKENIESNKTSPPKDAVPKRPRKINNCWTKYEKPVLKSNVEASAMCTKSYPLQYPCMITGCESVMNSEKSILKHYKVHGLGEKFLEQHRSHYIFCKKCPRQKSGSVKSDDSKSDSCESEPELTADNDSEQTQATDSRPFLRKRTCSVIPAALLDGLSNDDSSDGSVVMKRKRGRPKRLIEKIVKRKKWCRAPKASESRDEASDSSTAPSEEKEAEALASFKPMGFEMSFLKFLEQSNKTPPSFTSCDVPLVGPWVRLSQLNTKETFIRFTNRQQMKSLEKVKIVMDKAFIGVTELMLKQLQDMQPMVTLEKL